MRIEGLLSLKCAGLSQISRHGMRITIEHPKGTTRALKNDAGKVVYKKHMMHSYGFINKTTGRDGDEVDCFVGPMQSAKEVYVVHMRDLGPDKDQREDEDKCMIGFPSADAAKAAFLNHYPASFYESMTALPVAAFKQKLATAQMPYHKKKIHAGKKATKCPHCGGKHFVLMPTDFETAKCKSCKKNFDYIQSEAVIKYGGPGGTALGGNTL